MNVYRLLPSLLFMTLSTGLLCQERVSLGENAALGYWAAFAQLQDSVISGEQAKELSLILGGAAPYDDQKYKELVEKNRPALESMARASTLLQCNWGVDYRLGTKAPVDYVRRGLALGRLNGLYTVHLVRAGDQDGAVRALAAGLRFSQDLSSGGTLFAAISAKHLVEVHLRVLAGAFPTSTLSAQQRNALQKAIAQLGPEGLDWRSIVQQELAIDRGLDAQASAALARIAPLYIGALASPSALPELQQAIAKAPRPLPNIIPNPERVLRAKRELVNSLLQIRALLQN